MPSLTIHLYAGNKLRPNGSQLFFTGCLAPDAVTPWQVKEHAHLRDREDRNAELRKLEKAIPEDDDYANGVLFHLFCDYIWDNTALKNYKEAFGDGWYYPYRDQIYLAGSYIYHNDKRIAELWDLANDCPPDSYADSAYKVEADVPELISFHRNWHMENDIGPSVAFSPEYVENFAEFAVESFKKWKSSESYTLFF